MDAAKGTLSDIEVVVGLHPSLEHFAFVHDFRARIEQYLEDLLEDLHLPVNIELTTKLCEEPDRFPG
jgi:hypothetical protein